MFKRLSLVGIWAILSIRIVAAGQWAYDSAGGLLTHDTSGWILTAAQDGTNLTVTGVDTAPDSPGALPLADPAPGYVITGIGEGAFSNQELSHVLFPPGITRIGDYAFASCFHLSSVIIPASVTHIGASAFASCDSLVSIDVDSGNAHYVGVNGILYTKSLSELIQCPAGKTGIVAIPSGVVSVAYGAFWGCSDLSSVTLPDSVTSVGIYAFEDCASLSCLTLGNGVRRLGNQAFSYCGLLTELVLPAALSEIGYGAFNGCTALGSVTFEGAYPPEGFTGYYYELYSYNSVATSYVYEAHAASWEPHVADGPLAGGDALWLDRPIRRLANPATSVTVTLAGAGGAFDGPASLGGVFGTAYGVLPLPARAGHMFDGWWTGPNGAGLRVDAASIVSCARDHTLYAKWLVDVTSVASAALGTTNLTWYTAEAPLNWLADAEVSYDGDGAMRSAPGFSDCRIALKSVVTGPGILRFRWKASSDDDDHLQFYLDGQEARAAMPAETAWERVAIRVPEGEHTVEWVYTEEHRGYADFGCGWLDAVEWPVVTRTPENDFWLWESGLFGREWWSEPLAAAADGFTARLQDNPDDIAARVYRALMTIAKLAENENLRALVAEFGGTWEVANLLFSGAFDGDDAPPVNETADRTAAEWLPALDAALADLEAIPTDWNGSVEMNAHDSGFDETVFVDLADVLLAKAFLYAARAAIQLAQTYDLTADYAQTNVTEIVVAPYELPLITDPFNDPGFAAWNTVPELLVGHRGGLLYAKFARSGTQALLLLRAADGFELDNVYAGLTDENGARLRFNNLAVSTVPENETTSVLGGEECSATIDDFVEVTYFVLKSAGTILIARDAAWGPVPFTAVDAYFNVDGTVTGAGNGYDWADWESKTRTQPIPRFLEDHPAFMRSVRDATKLPPAKEDLRAALQAAQTADSVITGRMDQTWHFVEFNPAFSNDWAIARQKIAESLASLDAPLPVTICYTNETEDVIGYWETDVDDPVCHWFIVTGVETQRIEIVNQTETLHLGALFEPPYLTRAMLPSFTTGNLVMTGTFADPTFGGVMPAMTAAALEANISDRTPVKPAFEGHRLPPETVAPGGNATLFVTPTGSPALRWQMSDDGGVSWVDVPGADSAVLTVSGVAPVDSGRLYRVAATYEDGTAYSAPTSLTVTPAGGGNPPPPPPPPPATLLSEPGPQQQESVEPPSVSSAYSGFMYDDAGVLRGTVNVTAKPTRGGWALTAKALMQASSLSFSGTGDAPDTWQAEAKTGEQLDVTLSADAVFGTLSGGLLDETLNIAGARNTFADKKETASQEQLQDVKGLYNVALVSRDPGPQVLGYLSLTVGNRGAVKVAGKLADGTSVSGSAKLMEGLNDDGWLCIALHKPLYAKKGYLGGLLWLNPEDQVIRVDAANGWFMDWISEDPRKSSFAYAVDVCGGRWEGQAAAATSFSAAVPDDLPPAVDNLAGGWISEAFPWEIPVTVSGSQLALPKATPPKKVEGVFDYSGENPSAAKLSFAARTGLFKGAFKLYYDGETADGRVLHKSVNVGYLGVYVPVRDVAFSEWPVGLGIGTTKINKQAVNIPVFLTE